MPRDAGDSNFRFFESEKSYGKIDFGFGSVPFISELRSPIAPLCLFTIVSSCSVGFYGFYHLAYVALTYRRVVVGLWISDDFPFAFSSKPSDPTELQNQELIENF